MPFADYEDFDSCVASNQDKDDPEAYCAAIKREVEGEQSLTDEEMEAFRRMGAAEIHNERARLHTPRGLTEGTRAVERVSEGDHAVRYRNIMMLAPGEWTDAASRQTIFYDPEAIHASAGNWVDDQVNIYHEPGDPLANVGHIDTDSVHASGGGMYGDIVLHGRTDKSKEAQRLMDYALETEGERGIGGVSVEIPEDTTEWDADRGMQRMVEMKFSGVALVMHPASESVAFSEQFAQRAVAMARAMGGTEDDASVMVPTGERETTKQEGDGQEDMSEQDDVPDLVRNLRELQDQVEEVGAAVQDENDVALDAAGTYVNQEGNSREDDLSAFVAWAGEALEESQAAAVSAAADAFVEASDAEMGEATLGAFMDWASGDEESDEVGAPEEPGGGGQDMAEEPPGVDGVPGGDPTGSAEAPVDPTTVEAVATTVESVVETLDTAVTELKDEVEETQDEVSETQEQMEKLSKQLQEIADEPNTRSLSGDVTDGDGDEETAETTAPAFKRSADGYIER